MLLLFVFKDDWTGYVWNKWSIHIIPSVIKIFYCTVHRNFRKMWLMISKISSPNTGQKGHWGFNGSKKYPFLFSFKSNHHNIPGSWKSLMKTHIYIHNLKPCYKLRIRLKWEHRLNPVWLLYCVILPFALYLMHCLNLLQRIYIYYKSIIMRKRPKDIKMRS